MKRGRETGSRKKGSSGNQAMLSRRHLAPAMSLSPYLWGVEEIGTLGTARPCQLCGVGILLFGIEEAGEGRSRCMKHTKSN